MSWFAIGFTVASAVVSAYGQYQEGQATQDYNEYLGRKARAEGDYAYKIGVKNAEIAGDVAKGKGKQQKKEAARLAATQKAALASNSFDLLSVTAEDLLGETYSEAKADELAIRYNAEMQTWNIMEDAKYNRWAGEQAEEQHHVMGHNAVRKAGMKMTGTLLGAAASSVSIAGAAGKLGGGTKAAGSPGYSASTPSSARNMGSYTKFKV